VVPCGVDTALFTPDGPAEEKTRPFRIMSVGRLVPRKGVGSTISALARLAESGRDDIELVIVGGSRGADEIREDPDVQRLLAHARTEGVEHLVTFRGQLSRTELPAVLRSADLVVCAPWYEPFGIVPLEAMACGRPLVGTAVGGLLDTVVPGETGELVPPRRPDRLAQVLAGLLDDPDRRTAYGEAARQRAVRLYDWRRVVQQTEHVYRTVCGAVVRPTTEVIR
jgi:D-inositol-3-phosphate glycosyltransferase